jgi:hypothetical protein
LRDKAPTKLSAAAATKKVRELAESSGNIILINHAKKRGRQRVINRLQIERCLRLGTICEEPHIALKSGFWRMSFMRHAAGEEMTCVVEIDWPSKLLVVTVY